MAKRKAFKTAIDKVSESMKPEQLDKELEKASKMLKVELSTDTKSVQIGRPVDPEKAKRKKYTTMVNPVISKALKMEALRQDKTAADLLEEILKDYLKL